MAINIAAAFTIPAQSFGKGVKNFHFCTTAVVPNGTGVEAVTAFAGAGAWYAFRNLDTRGDYAAPPSFGGGGLECAVTGNMFLPGSSQDAITWLQNFATSSNVPCAAELSDGSYRYLGEVSLSGGAGTTSGINGGADHGIAVSFQSFLAGISSPRHITVATNSDLDAITTT